MLQTIQLLFSIASISKLVLQDGHLDRKTYGNACYKNVSFVVWLNSLHLQCWFLNLSWTKFWLFNYFFNCDSLSHRQINWCPIHYSWPLKIQTSNGGSWSELAFRKLANLQKALKCSNWIMVIMMHCSNLIQFACNTYNIDFLLHVSQKHQERNVNQIKRLLNLNLISLKLQKKELSNLNTFVLNSLLLGIFI